MWEAGEGRGISGEELTRGMLLLHWGMKAREVNTRAASSELDQARGCTGAWDVGSGLHLVRALVIGLPLVRPARPRSTQGCSGRAEGAGGGGCRARLVRRAVVVTLVHLWPPDDCRARVGEWVDKRREPEGGGYMNLHATVDRLGAHALSPSRACVLYATHR